MTTRHNIAKALRARCVYAFEDDPYTEVGKVLRKSTPGESDSWLFHVYVMTSSSQGGRNVRHYNAVIVGKNVEVIGPDEKVIGTMLKEPML